MMRLFSRAPVSDDRDQLITKQAAEIERLKGSVRFLQAALDDRAAKLSVFTAPRQRDEKGRYLPVVAS